MSNSQTFRYCGGLFFLIISVYLITRAEDLAALCTSITAVAMLGQVLREIL